MENKGSYFRNLWKNYNLSIVLVLLFLITWAAQFFVEAKQIAIEAKQHGREFVWSDFFVHFWSSTLQNWQSEFLQLLTFVVLTSFLIHKNSHESRDSDERMERKIDEIMQILKSDNKEK